MVMTFEEAKDQVEGWEKHWEVVNAQFPNGVNPHAYRLGFLKAAELYASSMAADLIKLFAEDVYKGYYVAKLDVEDILDQTYKWIEKHIGKDIPIQSSRSIDKTLSGALKLLEAQAIEINRLRETIQEKELIIYGIEEGAAQWESKVHDLKAEIEKLKSLRNDLVTSNKEYHDKIGDLKAEINSKAAQAWEEGYNAYTLSSNKSEFVKPINPYKP